MARLLVIFGRVVASWLLRLNQLLSQNLSLCRQIKGKPPAISAGSTAIKQGSPIPGRDPGATRHEARKTVLRTALCRCAIVVGSCVCRRGCMHGRRLACVFASPPPKCRSSLSRSSLLVQSSHQYMRALRSHDLHPYCIERRHGWERWCRDRDQGC